LAAPLQGARPHPRLIADWQYTPMAWFGVPVKEALVGK
jgi:hypothetical protein